MLNFNLPKDSASIIKVVGVGGGGSNAVNHMFNQGITGVDFIVCNTDAQALENSPIPCKVQLGATLTEGMGAGSEPEVGKNAAIESAEDIRNVLSNRTKMVFITAGMGGGTGTGAAPVIAQIAREMGILTVGIVTIPFSFEGKIRVQQAEQGLLELKAQVDTILVIKNDKLRELFGNMKMSECFANADNVLCNAAKGISDIINKTYYINTDFKDINKVMKDSGVAIMGSATALESDPNRAMIAVESAMNSPLLNDNDIKGARYILLNVTYGNDELTMDEFAEISDYIQEAAGGTANLIKGFGQDASLGDKISVTVIATGFTGKNNIDFGVTETPEKIVKNLYTGAPKVEKKTSVAPPEEKTTSETAELAPQNISFTVHEVENNSPVETEATSSVNEKEKEEDIVRLTFDPHAKPEKKETPKLRINSEDQVTLDFDDFGTTPSKDMYSPSHFEEPKDLKPKNKFKTKVVKAENALEESTQGEQQETQQRRATDRVARIKQVNTKIQSTQGLSDLEQMPAYMRKNVDLEDAPPSDESQVSRFTLSKEDNSERKIELRQNNSFLHDNVD